MDYFEYCYYQLCYDTDSDDEENNFGRDYDETYYYSSEEDSYEYKDGEC